MLLDINKKRLDKLYDNFSSNIFSEFEAKKVLNKSFSFSEVKKFEKFLCCSNCNIRISSLKILINNGGDLQKYYENYFNNIEPSNVINGLIEICCYTNDENVLSDIMIKYPNFVNKIAFILKKMGKEELLAPLLFSDDVSLCMFVQEILKERKNEQ